MIFVGLEQPWGGMPCELDCKHNFCEKKEDYAALVMEWIIRFHPFQ